MSRLELILQPQTYALLYVMMRRRRIRMMTVVLHETALFRKGPAAARSSVYTPAGSPLQTTTLNTPRLTPLVSAKKQTA